MAKYIVTFALLLTLVACSTAKEPTAQESASKQWNDARAGVLVGLAADQYKNANFDKSRSTVDEAIRLAPDNAAAHVLSAKLYIEAGTLEAAERELDVARKLDPAGAEEEYLSGVIFQRWQQPERALECYQHACDKAPAELAYCLAKAEMMVAMDRRHEALTMLQSKVAYFEHSGEIRDEVGLLLVQEQRYPEAIEMFRRAAILSPDDQSIREHLAMSLFYAKQFAEAGDVLTNLMKGSKDLHHPDLLIMLGECQLETKSPSDAAESFEEASLQMPQSSMVWLGLGRAQLELGNPRRAETALKRSLSLEDNSSEAHLLLGYVELRLNRLDEAYASFLAANHFNPADTVSMCMIGLTLNQLGRPKEAAEWYRKALKIDPSDEMANRLMARLDDE